MIEFNNYKKIGNLTEIYITQRDLTEHIVLIDTKKLRKLMDFGHRWHVQWHDDTQTYYAHCTVYRGTIEGKPTYENVTMQTVLFECDVFEMLDHINHNTLDNREQNIRKSLRHQNLKNRKSKNSNNTSGYRNVSWIRGYWRVQLQIDGKNHMFSEKFEDVDLAGDFAEEMRKKYYGDFSGRS